MSVFGYNYLQDKLGSDRVSKLRLLNYQGARGAGGDYAYEVLNFARPYMRVADIWKDLSAVYGPVPLEFVLEYLFALRDAGVVSLVQ